MPPKFFVPRHQPTPLDARAVVEHADHVADCFRLADPAGESEWLVLVDGSGRLALLPADQRACLRPHFQSAINSHQLLFPPRELLLSPLYLMAIESWEQAPDLPGPNDPVQLDGKLYGPFPSETAAVVEGRLTVTRADILAAVQRGAWHPFHGPAPTHATATPARWFHLLLPAGSGEEIREGRGAILAFPLSVAELELDMPGNERHVARLLFDVLKALKAEFEKAGLAGPLDSGELPVPSRAMLEAEMATRGYAVRGDAARRSMRGLLGRFLREEIALPPEGHVEDFLRLARAVLFEHFASHTSTRMAELEKRLRIRRVAWSDDGPCGLMPVQVPDHAGKFEMKNGTLVSPGALRLRGRCLYFDADESFSRHCSGTLQLEVEYLDVPGSLGIDYGSHDGMRGTTSIRMPGSGKWETAHFTLPDANFRNQVNGGTDFRLSFAARRSFQVRRVMVRAPAGAIPRPDPPPPPVAKKRARKAR